MSANNKDFVQHLAFGCNTTLTIMKPFGKKKASAISVNALSPMQLLLKVMTAFTGSC